MHSTAIVQSGMPTGKSYLSYWGEAKMKQKGVIQYGISPYRQAPMRGAVTHALFSGVGRIRRYAFWPTLAGIAVYSTLSWATEKNHYLNSKEGHRHGDHAG